MIPVIPALIAFILPVAVVARQMKDKPVRRPWLFCLGSFAAAFLAMWQELYTFTRRANAGDISGILDTAQSVLLISGAIAVITLALNLLAFAAAWQEKRQ